MLDLPLTEMQTAVSAVDDKGNVIDGDMILYVCGKYLKEQGKLDRQYGRYNGHVQSRALQSSG